MPKLQTYDETEDQYFGKINTRGSLKRLVRDIFSYKKYSRQVVASVLVTAVAGTLYPLSLGLAINSILSRNLQGLIFFGLMFLVLYIVQFFSNRIRTIASTRVAQSTIKGLRDRALANLQKVPLQFFGNVKTGYLISRITNDGEALSEFLTFQLPQVISGIATVIVSISIMLYLDWRLTMYALIVIPVLIGFTFAIQPKVRRNYLGTRRTIAAITGNLSENINAIRLIKSFNTEDRTAKQFSELNRNNYRSNMKAQRLSSIYGSIIRVIEALGITIVLIAGGIQLVSGMVTIGIMVAFVVYLQEFFDPVVQLSQTYTSYQSAMVGVGRIYAIIDTSGEAKSFRGSMVAEFNHSIDMREVSYAYTEEKALDSVTLSIPKGTKIGIVGHTGAGKTTLSNILLKFFDVNSGSLTIDGTELRSIETSSFRKLIAPVLQEQFLFRGSIYDNIIFNRPEISKSSIDNMCVLFGFDRIFSGLDHGMETNIGEMGRNLSEGQRQAVSILRALIREPEILIMDEPTSQIDPESESVIMKALSKYLSGKTLILITHRFSMISLVDNIVVLDHGKKVEEGKFSDLMKSGGTFSRLYRIQAGLQ
ncbi:putative branched-chain amino acid transport ATP-binding protein LivG [Thermoplasmatales archaeon]|nr:putative branched-chain amino acid transport ATP-binding protein LivG [Thermoplasmatales archaeon]